MTESPFATPTNRQSFSLGSLFLAFTIAAVFVAMLAPIARSEARPDRGLLMVTGVTFGITGLICGMIVGVHHHARLRGFLWGIGLGVLSAVASSVIWYGIAANPSQAIRLAFVGCVLMIGFAFVYYRLNQRDPSLTEESFDEFVQRWG